MFALPLKRLKKGTINADGAVKENQLNGLVGSSLDTNGLKLTMTVLLEEIPSLLEQVVFLEIAKESGLSTQYTTWA